MAIIPQITPRERQQSAPNPVYQSSAAATPDAFGASIGRGLGALGQGLSVVSDVMQSIQVQEQETELKTLDVKFSNQVRTLMYGDPENEVPGYLSTQNDDAVDGHVPLRDAIMKAREELVSSAGSDKVRNRFTIAADRRVNQAFTQAAQHATSARQSQALIISQARLANTVNDAANNPGTTKEGLAITESEVKSYLLKTGQSDEDVILNEVLKQQSILMMAGIAGALGRNDPEQAAMLLRQNTDFMTATDRAKASLSVLQSLTLNEAQTIFDEILGLGLKGEEAIEFARSNATGVIRSKLISLIDAEEGRSMARTRFAQGQDTRARAGKERDNIEAGIDLGQEAQDKGLIGQDAEDYVTERSDGVMQEKALQIVRTGESAGNARDRAAYEDFVKARTEFVDKELQDILNEVEDPEERAALLEQKRLLNPGQFTPTVVRMVKEKLSSQNTRDEALSRDRLREASEAASTAIAQEQTFDEFLSENPGYAAELMKSPQSMATFRAMTAAISSGKMYAGSSDGKTLLGLRNLSSVDIANTDLSLVRHNLTEREFNEIGQRQAGALGAIRAMESGDEGTAYVEARRVLATVLSKNLDYGSRDASEEDRKFTNRAEGNIFQAIGNARKQKGGPLSPVEIRDIVYRETAELSVDPPGIWNATELDLVERKDITSSQAASAIVEASVITDLAMRIMTADARRGTRYPSGIPLDIARQAYASFMIANSPLVSVKVRREAFARYHSLLMGEN